MTITSPCDGRSRPEISDKVVDFPAPDGPTIAQNSFLSIVRFISRSAVNTWLFGDGNCLYTSISWMTGSAKTLPSFADFPANNRQEDAATLRYAGWPSAYTAIRGLWLGRSHCRGHWPSHRCRHRGHGA